MKNQPLIEIIKNQFLLDLNGVHGVSHWARVCGNGLRLAEITGANVKVIELFAFFHDSKRISEGNDPEHGLRAARFAESLAGSVFELERTELTLLIEACRGHSGGKTHENITVLTCWDADRLDIGRIGIRPNPSRLLTEAAREESIMEWAYQRSIA